MAAQALKSRSRCKQPPAFKRLSKYAFDARRAELGAKRAELYAKGAGLETQAKVQEIPGQHANDLMQQMMDVMKDMREKLSSIEQSKLEATRGIIKNT